MKITDALRGMLRVFLDTAPVIYDVERHPHYGPLANDIFDRIDHGTLLGVTSPVTLLECLVVPCRLGQVQAQQDFTDLIVSGHGMTFVPLDQAVARRAAEIRARDNLSLADAFQVAVALAAGCDALLTNDATRKHVHQIPILVMDELER